MKKIILVCACALFLNGFITAQNPDSLYAWNLFSGTTPTNYYGSPELVKETSENLLSLFNGFAEDFPDLLVKGAVTTMPLANFYTSSDSFFKNREPFALYTATVQINEFRIPVGDKLGVTRLFIDENGDLVKGDKERFVDDTMQERKYVDLAVNSVNANVLWDFYGLVLDTAAKMPAFKEKGKFYVLTYVNINQKPKSQSPLSLLPILVSSGSPLQNSFGPVMPLMYFLPISNTEVSAAEKNTYTKKILQKYWPSRGSWLPIRTKLDKVHIEFHDDGWLDGDSISIYVNGVPLEENICVGCSQKVLVKKGKKVKQEIARTPRWQYELPLRNLHSEEFKITATSQGKTSLCTLQVKVLEFPRTYRYLGLKKGTSFAYRFIRDDRCTVCQ